MPKRQDAPVTVPEILSALRAGGTRIDDRDRREAEVQAAATVHSQAARDTLRKDLAAIRKRGK